MPSGAGTVDEAISVKAEMADHEEATCGIVGDAETSTEDDGFTVAKHKKSRKIIPPRDRTASSDSAKTDAAVVRQKDDSVIRATSSKSSTGCPVFLYFLIYPVIF